MLCHSIGQSHRDSDPWTRTTGDHAFSARAYAKTGDPRSAWENPSENGLSWRSRFFRSRSCQNRRPGLGKFEMEPVYHGDSPRKSGIYAKTRDLRPIWGNFQWNPLIMAIAKKNPIGSAKSFGLAKLFGLARPREFAPLNLPNHFRSLRISNRTR